MAAEDDRSRVDAIFVDIITSVAVAFVGVGVISFSGVGAGVGLSGGNISVDK